MGGRRGCYTTERTVRMARHRDIRRLGAATTGAEVPARRTAREGVGKHTGTWAGQVPGAPDVERADGGRSSTSIREWKACCGN